MRRKVTRAWLCLALLLLVPAAIYWPTVFHEYGFRDDYAHLREAREIPGHLVRFTSSYGRPVYGALLVASVRYLGGEVANLQWLRLGSVALLGLLGFVLMRLLQRSDWPASDSLAVGLAIAMLPAAQVIVGWSIAWPIALALLLALGGFAAVEAARARHGGPRIGAWAAGLAAYLVAGFIYQPSALFFVVPLAGALLTSRESARERLARSIAHVATALGGLALGFAIMKIAFAFGLRQAGVMGFETDPIAKLAWFVSMPVANALGLFALRDRFDTPLAFWLSVLAVTAVIAAGFACRANRDAADRWTVLGCLIALPFVAFAVNLAAALRVPGYRTIYGLAGLVLIFVVYALRSLRNAGRIGRGVHNAALTLMLAIGAVAASEHAYTLIAEPQGREWNIVREAVAAMPLAAGTKVYAIQNTVADRATRRTFADEFGSLSGDTDWAIAEMFKCALRQRFPSGLPRGFMYSFDAGLKPPAPGRFDLVIDMRKLSRYRVH